MNILLGVDLEKTAIFKQKKAINLISSFFTKKEIDYCLKKKEPHISFAGKFCTKEAIIKALKGKINLRDIEILNSSHGDPEIYIKGKKQKNIKCSISHTDSLAISMVVIIK